jgi:phosphate transport system substrate-binding protein
LQNRGTIERLHGGTLPSPRRLCRIRIPRQPPGLLLHWKESIAAQGNDGVAALIQLTPGAIGYIEFGYAKLTGLRMAALENRSHQFILPDEEGRSGEKALEDAEIPEDFQVKVPDPKSSDAYPITAVRAPRL